MIRVLLLEEEPLDPSDEDAALSDTQTTPSNTSVAVPVVQELLVIPSVLPGESFRKKLYCVDVTVKLLMLLPEISLHTMKNVCEKR